MEYFNPNETLESLQRKTNKALRNLFSKNISGSFLLEMLYKTKETYPYIKQLYPPQFTIEEFLVSSNKVMDYELCQIIVGCHSTNKIFLSKEEVFALEKSEEYKNKLAHNVEQNILLKNYSSRYLNKQPLIRGEPFIYYNLPYDLLCIAVKMNELLSSNKIAFSSFFSAISNKTFSALLMLENNLFDCIYPICRSIIEIFVKFLLVRSCPDAHAAFQSFLTYDISRSCCNQKYPDEFNTYFNNRLNKSTENTSSFLNYGWVDKIPNYHKIVPNNPYSFNGLLKYLRKTQTNENERGYFSELERLHKGCNAYTHGSVARSKYPLLHYFEISSMLFLVIDYMYRLLCETLNVSTTINNVNIEEKALQDYERLDSQYRQQSTELYERHYCKD